MPPCPGRSSLIGGPAEDLTQRVVDEAIAGTLALPEIDAAHRAHRGDRRRRADEPAVRRERAGCASTATRSSSTSTPWCSRPPYRIDELIPDWASDAVPALSAETLLPDQIDGGGLELALGEVPVLLEARDTLDTLGRPGPAVRRGRCGADRGRPPPGPPPAAGSSSASASRWPPSAAIVGTGMPIDAVFGGDIGLLEEVAGASFVSIDGDALMARSLPLVGAGLALATVAALAVTRQPPPRPRRLPDAAAPAGRRPTPSAPDSVTAPTSVPLTNGDLPMREGTSATTRHRDCTRPRHHPPLPRHRTRPSLGGRGARRLQDVR